MMVKRALGRGLEALIPENVSMPEKEIIDVSVARIKSGRYQPRIDFNEEKQQDLTASIKEKGVVQPIIIRPVNGDYELIAGERRLRAVKSLGIEKLPAIVKDVDDEQAFELSIIENIQRENLNPIEEAKAYAKLSDEFGLTQDEVARKVGKNRATVANTLRLLKLPDGIQEDIMASRVTVGHAKVLLMLLGSKAQKKLRDQIVSRQLSVREAERYIERIKSPQAHRRRRETQKSPELLKIEEILRNALGTQVRIVPGKRKGKIEIEYYSHEDLERILEVVGATMDS